MPNKKPRRHPERPSPQQVDFALDLIPRAGPPAPGGCVVPGCPGDPDWVFGDGALCQEHFEGYSSDTFWADQLGEPIREVRQWAGDPS